MVRILIDYADEMNGVFIVFFFCFQYQTAANDDDVVAGVLRHFEWGYAPIYVVVAGKEGVARRESEQ